MINSRELALSPFETALLEENPYSSSPINQSLPGKAVIVLSVLLFSLFSSPRIQAREQTLSPESLMGLINQDRIKQGIIPLSENLKLDAAAEAKARDMLAKGYFAHVAPNGEKAWDFIKIAGLRYAFAGENLAINYTSAYELENDFLDSPSHRDNLLSPVFSEVGIAVLEGQYLGKPAVVTVEMFARQ